MIWNEHQPSGRALAVSSPAYSTETTVRRINVLTIFAGITLTTPVSGHFASIEDVRACNAKQ